MEQQLGKLYDPKAVEDKVYKNWLDKKYFNAKVDPDKKPYTIVIPPPNITGQLHMGHALDNTLQDILIRTKRMQGYSALWLPGTDHASIATEAKIVEAMKAEGVSKDDLGREGFLERAWKWKEQYGGRIIEQLKKLGSSCDWDRERFTLDEGCSEAVKHVFINLYNKGLIYRGERMVNWCPNCLTTISDAEVDFEESDGFFWHIRYPLSDGTGHLELATTRPETMLGDTAVAVNPDDERYKHLIGKTVKLPLVGKDIPIIGDNYAEMDFGTGVVKVTPAHDPNDFEAGIRNNLEVINIFNEDATVNENGGEYQGLDRYEARKLIVKQLEEQGFLIKTEPIKHNVGKCYRCGTTVEPRLSLQWFVDMKPLAKPAIKAVESDDIQFVPERFEKTYFNWMYNIKDWCISRQLWWGHRIPAYYCDDCSELVVSDKHETVCPKCGGKLKQDEDTLDTWFSSALWPFSTLGWPENTEDLKYFYPTDVLVTGYDIIFFWVARMIFSGLENMNERPFHTVFIHGIVRAADGKKMSKSSGNGIDPLDIIEEYGADALRYMLASGTTPGNDMRFSDEKVKASRNFANKLWNAARFILMNDVSGVKADSLPSSLNIEDKWILCQLNTLVKEVNDNIEKYELGVAAGKVYDFTWDVFCDWYVEISKLRLNGEDEVQKENCKQILVYVMTNILKLLHPFMPFITEEIYLAMPHSDESIMISAFPTYDEKLNFAKEKDDFTKIMDVIKAVRVIRAEKNVPASKKADFYIETANTELFELGTVFIERLAYANKVYIGNKFEIDGAAQTATDSARILIEMDQLVDKKKELERLNKEKSDCMREIELVEQRLSNEQFVSKAPEKVVNIEKEKLEKAKQKLELLEQSIASMA